MREKPRQEKDKSVADLALGEPRRPQPVPSVWLLSLLNGWLATTCYNRFPSSSVVTPWGLGSWPWPTVATDQLHHQLKCHRSPCGSHIISLKIIFAGICSPMDSCLSWLMVCTSVALLVAITPDVLNVAGTRRDQFPSTFLSTSAASSPGSFALKLWWQLRYEG